jgi:hypothetical protein
MYYIIITTLFILTCDLFMLTCDLGRLLFLLSSNMLYHVQTEHGADSLRKNSTMSYSRNSFRYNGYGDHVQPILPYFRNISSLCCELWVIWECLFFLTHYFDQRDCWNRKTSSSPVTTNSSSWNIFYGVRTLFLEYDIVEFF